MGRENRLARVRTKIRRNGPVWLATCSCLAVATAATAGGTDDPPPGSDEYRVDLAYGGRWCDAEKTRASTRDDLACWAAAAANMLAWTGWGIDAGFKDEDEILAYLVISSTRAAIREPSAAEASSRTPSFRNTFGRVRAAGCTGGWAAR
jgi:hypothetical protein